LINEESGIILNDRIFNHYLYKQKNFMIDYNNYDKYSFVETTRKSCLNDILKCHDIKYIKALKYKSDNIKNKINKNEPHNFWDNIDLDLIEKNYFLYKNENNESENMDNTIDNSIDLYNYQKIDIDTFINQYSYENIYNTTGCVFDAIDEVMEGRAMNAFALIRPPGHHSGYYGPVENEIETSNGFCIVNNVAIGAAYAKYKYSDELKKIAIIDIDVHHGNGTEEIVEMLNYKNFTKPFKYEKICGVKLMEKQNINWLDFDDSKNVLFISTHIYDKNNPDKFYPYSGSEEKNTRKESDIYPGGIYNIPFELKENYPHEYKNILRSKIIPRLYKFKPDILLVSAGFDGHKLESINQNHMLLQENDYGYIAQQLQFVANKFCKRRMIAILEGGYNANTGIISSFAQSVFTFIRYMNIGINVLQCYDVKLTSNKRKMQYNEEMELYNMFYKTKIKQRRSERIKQMEEKDKKEELKNDNQNSNSIVSKDNNVDNNKNDNQNINQNKDNNENTKNEV
jgi:acetoin utilization deacetylase AcuC-like enzyme